MKKTKILKKIITVISLVMVIATLSSVTAFAALPKDELVQPLWDSILHMEVVIVYDDGIGTASGLASRQSTASFIEGTLTVYKKVNGQWVFVDDAYNSRSRVSLGVDLDFPAESGVTYKAVFTVTAYTNNVPETHTIYYTETCP